jgi:hypothetical protein
MVITIRLLEQFIGLLIVLVTLLRMRLEEIFSKTLFFLQIVTETTDRESRWIEDHCRYIFPADGHSILRHSRSAAHSTGFKTEATKNNVSAERFQSGH